MMLDAFDVARWVSASRPNREKKRERVSWRFWIFVATVTAFVGKDEAAVLFVVQVARFAELLHHGW